MLHLMMTLRQHCPYQHHHHHQSAFKNTSAHMLNEKGSPFISRRALPPNTRTLSAMGQAPSLAAQSSSDGVAPGAGSRRKRFRLSEQHQLFGKTKKAGLIGADCS